MRPFRVVSTRRLRSLCTLVLIALIGLAGAAERRPSVHADVFFGFGVLEEHQREQVWLAEQLVSDLRAHGAEVVEALPEEPAGVWLVQAVVSRRPGLDGKPAVHVTLTCDELGSTAAGGWYERTVEIADDYDRVPVLDHLHRLLQQARRRLPIGD